MRLAYFSPLPPQKSGISNYSEILLPYLSRYYEIDLWVCGSKPNAALARAHRVVDYGKRRSLLEKLENYDAILYNMGNNPEFHTDIYEIFLNYPGVVILHDYVLYYLITGYFLDYQRDRKGYIREFYYNYGSEGISAVKTILRGHLPPLQFQHPERYPLIRRLIETAHGIIVHSESARKMLLDAGCPASKVVKINHVNSANMNFTCTDEEISEIRRKYGVADNEILIASFGYIAPTKRNEQVIRAINEIASSKSVLLEYLMVGTGNYVDGLLSDRIKKTDFVSKSDYEKLLCSSDIVVNLRYPSMGETSGTLIQAMTAGKPCIVSDDGWFSELPDDSVIKISVDELKGKRELIDTLELLISDSQKRTELGIKAQGYALRDHDPSYIADEMSKFINNCMLLEKREFVKMYSVIHFNRVKEIGLNGAKNLRFRWYRMYDTRRFNEIGLRQKTEKWKYLKKIIMQFTR